MIAWMEGTCSWQIARPPTLELSNDLQLGQHN